MKNNESESWSPYLAGALSGMVIVLSVLLSGRYFGASTSFARTAGLIEKTLLPSRFADIEYFRLIVPTIDWQWMFVFGIFLGSLLSAVSSRTFQWRGVPDMWLAYFGSGRLKRAIAAFTGGAIAMFGARLAGG